jgi:DNA-directed RNA polymerase subunit RPC12/RpoP
MAHKILCAGFNKDEKSAVEAQVKPVLAARPKEEAWTVSLVKTGSRLAVSVDGPDERLRAKNFVADLPELRKELSDLLGRAGFGPPGYAAPPPVRPAAPARDEAPPAAAAPGSSAPDGEYEWEPPPGPGERRDSYTCAKCNRRFAVIYDHNPKEPRQTVSVACPHCWQVDRVEVSEGAALAREYRAHKLNA